MSRWWRAYDEALDDPKLQKLGLEMIGAWFNLLCMASRNNGAIMVADVPFSLRVPKAKAAEVITRLVTAGLLDRKGDDYEPHKWGERQFKSDGSTERVKRFRKQERNVSCNVSETETKQELKRPENENETGPESDTEQNRKKKSDGSRAREAEKSKPPTIRPEAYEISAECLKALGFPSVIDAPLSFAGLPYQVEILLSRAVPPPIIVGKFAELQEHRTKPMNYFIRAIENSHADQSKPRPIDGRDTRPTVYGKLPASGNIVAAADRLIERLADFDRPGPPTVRGGSGEAVVRLLPKG